MEIFSFIVSFLLFIEQTTTQKVFTQTELKDSYKSFDGSGCPKDNRTFDSSKKKYFRYLQESRHNVKNLYVGAMNNVYKIDLNNMQCLNFNDDFKPTANTIRRCNIQGKLKAVECQNHIRVVMEMNDGLLVCGTGGYAPIRFRLNRDMEDLEKNETFNGIAYCPFDPWDNYTAILVTQGNPGNAEVPYFGTYGDFIKSAPLFHRPRFEVGNVSYLEKKSDAEESTWLNSPQFVGSFDDDKKVMFFFRETALENLERTVAYSRVGKVCKQDLGAGHNAATKKIWLSFQKARLVCSLPGSLPRYFNEINDVYQDGDLFYGVFFKPQEYDGDNVASAVCVYKKSDIETVFKGNFQYKNTEGAWVPLPEELKLDPRLDNCTAHEKNPDIFSKSKSDYQLMADGVQPMYGKPIWYKNNVQLLKIAVSETKRNGDETGKNIYLASDEGEIHDIFMKTYESSQTFLVENTTTIYRPFTSKKNRDFSVWNMKILNNTLVMGTDYNVTRFNVDNVCSKIKEINICVANTHCKWNKCDGSCMKAASGSECTTFVDWKNITNKGVIVSLRDEIEESAEENLPTVGGLYFTVPYKSKIFTDDIFWYNSEHCTGTNVLLKDPEKYAISFSKDLVIKNLTQDTDDNARYSMCFQGQETLKLKGYKITVAVEDEQIIEVWKQQFNEWSSAFVKWKGCTKALYDSCDANGGG